MNKRVLGIFTASFIIILCSTVCASAQRISLKTNMIDWTTMAPNLEVELTFTNLVSFELGVAYAPFKLDNLSTKRVSVTPEVKFWLGMPSIAHAIGVGSTVTYGDFLMNDKHFEGLSICFGPTYTYAFILSEHWNFELTGGIGCYYFKGYYYDPDVPKTAVPNSELWSAGLYKLGATFVYIIK